MNQHGDHSGKPGESTAAQAGDAGGGPAQPNPLPDREVVAQIALDLTRLNSNPSDAERLETAQADIQNQGLTAFFHAAVQTLAAESAREVQTGQMQMTPALVQAPQEDEPILPGANSGSAPDLVPAFALPLPVLPGVTGTQGSTRQTWFDCICARSTQPMCIFYPASLDDLRGILQQAEAKNCRVKAVGSGHSFADVASTRDFLVETHGLCQVTEHLDLSILRPGAHPESLFETEAGITVRDLNEALWNAGFGLENMGGYDGQTIAGVISTSTHGTGIRFGPLSSQPVSLTIVAAGGRTVRVEPAGGITDPQAWAAQHKDIELIQDDDWFNACQVGLGCMGILYSVVLRVVPKYMLKEQRTLSNWFDVRKDLQQGQVLRDNVHYEVLVNPYSTLPGGNHTCLITCRNPVDVSEQTTEPSHRNILIELAASIPGQGDVLLAVLNTFPNLTPEIVDGAMKAIVGEYTDRSYRVFNIGMANNVPAYGSEIGFPMTSYLSAVDHILEITTLRQSLGQAYLNSPFSLRFVKASSAHMSMMEGTDTCMVEFISLDHTIGGKELLQELETEMYAFGGRPHWGLLNFLTGAGGLVEAMYPMLPRWQAVRCELDPNGRFANAFTERCGLTPLTFQRS